MNKELILEAIKGLNKEKQILTVALTGVNRNKAIEISSRLNSVDKEIRELLKNDR